MLFTERDAEILGGNRTRLQAHAKNIRVDGPKLTVKDPATPLAVDTNGFTVAAYYSNPNSGRVFVSSSFTWMSSLYLTSPSRFPNALDFTLDVFDFLALDTQVEEVSASITSDMIDVTVQVRENGIPINGTPSIRIIDNDLVKGISPNVTDLGNGTFRVTVEYTVEGIYPLEIAQGSDYLRYKGLKDISPPEITTRSRQDRNYSSSKTGIFYQFVASDPLSGVNMSTVKVSIDNMTTGFQVAIDEGTGKIFVTFSASIVDLTLAEHHLVVKVSDNFGNVGSIDMRFYVYKDPNATTTTTTTTTSPTSNTTTTLTTSNTTTAITTTNTSTTLSSSTTPKPSSSLTSTDKSGLVISFLIAVLATMTMAFVIRRNRMH